MRPLRLLIFLGALLLVTSPLSADEQWPAAIRALGDQGLETHAEFESINGLTGYAASYPGGEVAIYLLPDGEHAIVGTLVDAEGNDLSAAALDEFIRIPQDSVMWQRLEDSHWIADGDADAARIVYTFTDPNCPYCHQFWESARPWVEAGEVQLRHVMVGILTQDSPAKAAALLGAENPAAALHAHSSGEEPIAPSAQPHDIEERVYHNNQLADEMGVYVTPAIFYRDGERLERVDGVPSDEHLELVMGNEQR